MARLQLPRATGLDRAWLLGTLAELELLGAVYGGDRCRTEDARTNIAGYCKELCALGLADTFPVESTERQFARYVRFWPRDEWTLLAEAAQRALSI